MIVWNEDAFIGGHPTLDFVNTVDDQDKSRKLSRLADWADFLSWAQASSLFSEEQMHALENEIQQTEISTLLTKIHKLRETEYAALSGVVSGDKAPNAAMLKLEEGIRAAIRRSSLLRGEEGYIWLPSMDHPDWVIDVLLLSIESLLRSPGIVRLRECGRCTWMFLNKGRGRGRRWCDMSKCGNRAKSESFRNREH
ncbi:MAG: CGNR zinc finger domain-containing protein [Amphritea sp.]